MPRLAQIEGQCAAALTITSPNPHLIDENFRGYVMLLSAHFQGVCRDLYTEAAQIVVARVRPSLQLLFQTQFSTHLILDHGNPNIDNLARDFNRFGFDIRAELSASPANTLHRQHLAELNRWWNVAAHQGTSLPVGIPLTLPGLQAWRASCDALAVSLDAIMYNQLRRILRRAPWVP